MIDKTMQEISHVASDILIGWKKEETRCCVRFIYSSVFYDDSIIVEISQDVSNTFYIKVDCTLSKYIRGISLTPINEYDELVTYLKNIKNKVNSDMVSDLELELSSVASNYIKGLLN